jgi:hypothetical protein
MLHEFIAEHRQEIISRCKDKVAQRSASTSAGGNIDAGIVDHGIVDHGVPLFLDQLIKELRIGLSPSPEIRKSAAQNGQALLRQGFTVSQVVHGYGDVCQTITEMGVALDAPISTNDFRMLNRCLDDAIASAVTEYGRESDAAAIAGPPAIERSSRVERTGGDEHLGVLVRELRTTIHTATVAMQVVKSGSVGIAGSTGTLLEKSLASAEDLLDRLLAEVYAARRTSGTVM